MYPDQMWSWLAGDGALEPMSISLMHLDQAVGTELARDDGLTVAHFWRLYPNQTVGAGLPAMAA
jgi:hypothetical protein